MDIQNANERFMKGVHIEYTEMKALLKLYTNACESLSFLGERHHFSLRDCADQKSRLEKMIELSKTK